MEHTHMANTELMDMPSTEHRALSLVQRDGNGAIALAMITDADFESRITAMKVGRDRVRRIQSELMREDEDYGVIPGTKKPTLLKPGAETLCQAYGLVPSFKNDTILGDGFTTPHIRIVTTCELHMGSKDGPVVGEGGGAANSWERKHRYRTAQRHCPACGVDGAIKRSKFEDRVTGDKGWYCHAASGGCGKQFKSDDPAITDQQGGQVENPDPFDVENTLLKMSAKRAQIDAVLRATATSGLFTQDVEDIAPAPDANARAPKGPAQPAAAPAPQEGGEVIESLTVANTEHGKRWILKTDRREYATADADLAAELERARAAGLLIRTDSTIVENGKGRRINRLDHFTTEARS